MEFFACAYASVPFFALFSAPKSVFNLLSSFEAAAAATPKASFVSACRRAASLLAVENL